jgi:hypothetical protein
MARYLPLAAIVSWYRIEPQHSPRRSGNGSLLAREPGNCNQLVHGATASALGAHLDYHALPAGQAGLFLSHSP